MENPTIRTWGIFLDQVLENVTFSVPKTQSHKPTKPQSGFCIQLVEAGGFEPPSVSSLPSGLHA
jgi:hypothetical protein